MAGILSALSLSPLLKPIVKDLYEGAKGKAKEGLKKWSTDQGVKRAATALLRIEKVKTIWSPENEITLQKFYYPSKVTINNKRTVVANIESLPHGNIVIEGIVGQGKSIFMRHLAVSSVAATPIRYIPIFIELRTLSSKRSLQDAILCTMNSLSLSSDIETFDYLASSGKIILMLDGFDEIPNECITETIVELESMHFKHAELKIIISSRPRSHIQNVASFKVVKLVPLTPIDYDPFIAKLVNPVAKRFDITSALSSCPDNIKGIICTPLMLTLVVIVYQTEKQIPSTLSEFFEKLFGTVFSKHDRLKAGFNRQHHSGLSEHRLKQLFDTFCFMIIHHQGGRSLSSADFEAAFDRSLKYSKEHKCDLSGFRKDIINVACLMVEEGFDTVTFLHKSILDYHAAAFVKSLPDAQAKKFYEAAFNRSAQWVHVLEFLKSIDPLRYTRDYYLEFIPDLASELKEMEEFASDGDLLEYLDELLPEFYMKIDNYTVLEAGPMSFSGAEFYGELTDNLADALILIIDDSSNSDDVDRTIALSQSLDTDTLGAGTVNLSAIVRVFGTDRIREVLNEYALNTSHNITISRKYFESEQIKMNSFVNILDFQSDF